MPSQPLAATRARASWMLPLTWRRPLTIGLLVLMAAGLVVPAIISSPQNAPQPIDYGLFGPLGADILTGRWVGIFRHPIVQAGPLELIFWGVPNLLGIGGVVPWIITQIVAGVLLSIALAVLVDRLMRPLTTDWAVTVGIAVAALAALSGRTTGAISVGHPAEFVIPLLWVVGAVLARRGGVRWVVAAAALIAASAGWELWGLLGVPVLLLAPRIRFGMIWRAALAGVVVLAAMFLPFVLLGPFRMFAWTWHIDDRTLTHLLFPELTDFPWTLRLAQGLLSIGAGAAVARILHGRRDAIWLVPVTVCAMRLLTDPVMFGYYATPALIMILIGAAFAGFQRQPVILVGCLLIFNLLVDFPLSAITGGILVVLVAGVVVVAARHPGRGMASH